MSDGRPVTGHIVRLLHETRVDRGMTLCEFESRCLAFNEIHEIVTTDHIEAKAGDCIDRVGFIGFCEIQSGGVVARGDSVKIAGRVLGTVLGFDECHYPNHYNLLIATDELMTGPALSLEVSDEVVIEPKEGGI